MKAYSLLAVAVASLPAFGQFGISGQTVAITGQPAYGSGPGENFSLMFPGCISNNGLVAFPARSVVSSSEFKGAFTWQSGQGTRLGRQGDLIPDHPSLRYSAFDYPRVDESGRVAFIANTDQSNNTALIAGTSGNLHTLGVTAFNAGNDPNPHPTYQYLIPYIGTPMVTRGGTISFTDNNAVRRHWSGPSNDLQVVLQPGSVPGYPVGATVNNLGFDRVAEDGRVLALGQINGAGYTGQRVLVLAGRTGEAVIAGPGMAAPGVAGTLFEAGPPASINGSGLIGFAAPYQIQPGGPLLRGAWVGQPGAFQPLVLSGQAAPGLAAGYQFSDLDTPEVNHAGNALILGYATKSGTPGFKAGLWTNSNGSLNLAYTDGMVISNMASGTTVRSLDRLTDGTAPTAFNNRGQIAVMADINVPGSSPKIALLASDLSGALVAVASVGFLYQIAPGDSRMVSEISVRSTDTSGTLAASSTDDGFGTFFNDRGDLLFALYFADGTSGVFVASVPEPSAASLLGLACVVSLRRRRRI